MWVTMMLNHGANTGYETLDGQGLTNNTEAEVKTVLQNLPLPSQMTRYE